MKKNLTKFIAIALLISLTSATIIPISESTLPEQSNYQVIKKEVEQLKGEKLTLKERIALKIFNKELSKIEKERGVKQMPGNTGGKSQLIALILCFFIGYLGIHRFYLGYTGAGVIQLLTAGGCGIWWLIDFIRIITGNLKPKNGSYTQTL